MKTRLDEPHLEKLRHDYQLLRESYRDEQESPMWTVLLIFGWICFVTAIAGALMVLGG